MRDWLAAELGRTGLSALVAKKEKWTGVLAAPLRDGEARRRGEGDGIGGEDDRGRPRRGQCGK